VPAGVNKNNTAVLNAVFLFIKGLFVRKNNKYFVSPGFFNNVNLGRGREGGPVTT
jgi:hypothetical protein